MIQCQYHNTTVIGVGNRMFQYAFARIVAEKNGMALTCDELYPGFANAVPVDGRKAGIAKRVCADGNASDVYSAPSLPCGMVVNGYFQNYNYYFRHKEAIREWFKLAPSPCKMDDTTVVAHVRRWDYVGTENLLALSFYRKALESMEWKRLIVIGVGIDDSVKNWFAEYNPEYPNGNPVEDMATLYGANKIIISNSTFAWWGAWLSDAEIWGPVPVSGYFSPTSHQRLRVDEPRYHWIEGVEIEE